MWPMQYDVLKDKTEIYRCKARLPLSSWLAFLAVLALVALCALVIWLLSPLPYSAFLKIAVLILTAWALNYVLKKGAFSVTYVLTDDGSLVYITKYGRLEWESAWIDLSQAKIQENKIIYQNRKYDFYPDERLASYTDNYKGELK